MEYMLPTVVVFCLVLALIYFLDNISMSKKCYDIGRVHIKPHKNQKRKPSTPKPNFNPPFPPWAR